MLMLSALYVEVRILATVILLVHLSMHQLAEAEILPFCSHFLLSS